MKKTAGALFLAITVSSPPAGAAEPEKRIEELERRVEELEEAVKEEYVPGEPGHRLHPVHSLWGLKISGGITLTAQGAEGPETSGGEGGGGAISADLYL